MSVLSSSIFEGGDASRTAASQIAEKVKSSGSGLSSADLSALAEALADGSKGTAAKREARYRAKSESAPARDEKMSAFAGCRPRPSLACRAAYAEPGAWGVAFCGQPGAESSAHERNSP